MIALSDATEITAVIALFFLLLALLTVLRLILRKEEPVWRALRVGFFVERLPEETAKPPEREPMPPTTYMPPDRSQL